MKFRLFILCVTVLGLAAGSASLLSQVKSDSTNTLPPGLQWKLPLFTKEGFRSMSLRGDRVIPIGSDRIDVDNIEIMVFSGDKKQTVSTILLSPKASYYAKAAEVKGSGEVRVIRDNGEISGENWQYKRVGEKISIRRNARVVFKEQVTDMLR
ncbi:MAG: hypothetical protein WCO38_06220 [Verrucomicrobiota bacterium]|nr:MAG: hypothetical protein DVB35_06170 [Verrucomicrobiota bacterium]